MKPLPVPGGPSFQEESGSSDSDEASTLEKREAQGTENWNRLKEEAERKRQKEARNEAIKKARDKAKRFEKLDGKGLGDAEEDEVDTKTWLLQQKKRQKRLEKERARAKKMEEELRQREEQAYTSKDLAGVKVGHQASVFEAEGGDQILILKDATIDENEEEGDELENLDLREQERRDNRLNVLKKKPAYDPNAEESDEDSRTVLKQYDEAIDGKKRKRFTLDADGAASEVAPQKQATENARKAQAISLDILNEVATSDYQQPKEVVFKKPKKSKKKSTRQKVFDDDDGIPSVQGIEDRMDIDPDTPAQPRSIAETLIDDDDLQASLAKTRRQALKKRKRTSAKELAHQLKNAVPAEQPIDDDTSLVINETSEWVANLRPSEIEERPSRVSYAAEPIPGTKPADVESDEDVDMKESQSPVDQSREGAEEPKVNQQDQLLTETGLDADAQLTQGIGSALNLLRQRGLVEKTEADVSAQFRAQQQFLREKQRRDEAAELKARQQRERDRTSGRLDRMSAREREDYARRENLQRDQLESRQMADLFNREYRPSVELRYVDEHGRSMGKKEAFKHLSHQFHGKGSGKQKTEKHLKKIKEEKKAASQSVLGSGQTTGLNNALGSTAKKQKQAGVRLA